MKSDDVRRRKVLEELEYMEDSHTVQETAAHFNRNEKTVRVHLKNIGTILGEEYVERAKLVKANNYSSAAKRKRISSAGRKPSISDEKIKSITEDIVYRGATLRDENKKCGIPKSTIHDNITPERVGEELYKLYTTTAEFHRTTINQNVESPIVTAHRKK